MPDDTTSHVDISGFDKAELLAALVNGTQPLGLGALQARGEFTVAEARKWLGGTRSHDTIDANIFPRQGMYFDYVAGRPIKTDIAGDTADPRLYDRDAGKGALARVVAALRERLAGVVTASTSAPDKKDKKDKMRKKALKRLIDEAKSSSAGKTPEDFEEFCDKWGYK